MKACYKIMIQDEKVVWSKSHWTVKRVFRERVFPWNKDIQMKIKLHIYEAM